MSQTTRPATSSAGTSVKLTTPAPGSSVTYRSAPGNALIFDFDPSQAQLSRSGNALVIKIGDATIIIEDFFAVGSAHLPGITLSDGSIVDVGAFLASLGIDLTPEPLPRDYSGSGITLYKDDPGDLIYGVRRAPSLPTDYWARARDDDDFFTGLSASELPAKLSLNFLGGLGKRALSENESADGIFLVFTLDKALRGDVILKLGLGGDLRIWGQPGVADYIADIEVPAGCRLQFDGVNWFIEVTIPSGSTGLSLFFPLRDDHISEGPEQFVCTILEYSGPMTLGDNERISFTVKDDTRPQWDGLGPDGKWDNGVTDDLTNPARQGLDGPAVGVVKTAETPAGVTDFQITLTDIRSSAPYTGFAGGGFLVQDITVSINPSGPGSEIFFGNGWISADGQHGASFHMEPTAALLQLKAAGMVDFQLNAQGWFEPDATGNIRIILYGKLDANGEPHGADGTQAFLLSDVGKLSLQAVPRDDAITQLSAKEFFVTVVSVEGNEASIGEQAAGTRPRDTPGLFSGPEIALTVPVLPVPESAVPDGIYAPADNESFFAVNMRGGVHGNGLAGEPVYMTLRLGGGSATYGASSGPLHGTADYYLSGVWTSGTDRSGNACLISSVRATGPGGISREVTLYRYDGNGETFIKFALPLGTNSLKIGFRVKDDLFETEGMENFNATLTLDEKIGGLPYGEAHIAGMTPQASVQTGTTSAVSIAEDKRPGPDEPGNLAPADFDGPFVVLTTQSKIVAESTGITGDTDAERNHAEYTLTLLSPTGNGTRFTAQEDITVSIKVSFGTADDKDIDLSGVKLADGTPVTVFGPDANGNYTFTVTVPRGSAELSFTIPLVDDHVGGVPLFREGQETFTLQIIEVTGNEARLWDASAGGTPPAGLEEGPEYVGDRVTTIIVDDITPARKDGPVLNVVARGASSSIAQVVEGESLLFRLDPRDPSDPSKAYGGYRDNHELSDDMIITFKVTGTGGATYGPAGAGDFSINDNQPVLDQLRNMGVIDAYYVRHGSGTITVLINGSNPWTNEPTSANFLKMIAVSMTVHNDALTELTEGFEITVSSVAGNESRPGQPCVVRNIKDDTNGPYVNITQEPFEMEGNDLVFRLTLSATNNGAHNSSLAAQSIRIALEFFQGPSGGARFYPATGSIGAEAAVTQDYDLDLAVIYLQSLGYQNVSVVYTPQADGSATARLSLTVPPTLWGAGGVDLRIPTLNDGFSEGQEPVLVSLVEVLGSEARIGKDSTMGTIYDQTSLQIDITGVPHIYEDPAYGAAVEGAAQGNGQPWNTALYTVSFTPAMPFTHAVENFSFKVNIESGTAKYDGNAANDTKPADLGDFRWFFQDALIAGNVPGATTMTPDSDGRLLAAVNAWLHGNGYLHAGISVTAIGGTNGSVLTMTVSKGFDFSLTGYCRLGIVALDDARNDDLENYKITISDPKGHESFIGTAEARTDIYDDQGIYMDGLVLGALATFTLNESAPGAVNVPFTLYKNDGTTLASAADLQNLYETTTVKLTFDSSSFSAQAQAWKDYRTEGMVDNGNGTWSVTLRIGPGDWDAIGGGRVGFLLPLNATDNVFTDGNRQFSIKVDSLTGNEIRLKNPGVSTTVTIKDDTILPRDMDSGGIYDNTDRSGNNILDGPKFDAFLQRGGSVSEPVYGQVRTVTYDILFDTKISEPILVVLSAARLNGVTVRVNGLPSSGFADVDVCFAGSNMGMLRSDGTVVFDGVDYASMSALWTAKMGAAPAPAYMTGTVQSNQFFLLGELGDTSIAYSMNVLPDRISEANEGIKWTISKMVGNEVLFDPQINKTLTTLIQG